MTNDAFWGLTLRQFELLAERRSLELKRADRRAGGIIATLYNFNTRTKETDPIHDWTDFFTEWREPVKLEPQTEEETFQAMLLWTKKTNEGLSH